MTLVGGATSTGSITTAAPGSQVYMADDSMFITGGGTLDGEGNFDPSIVLALDPVPTGGSITINGPVSTGLFRAAAGTGLTTQAITASNIEASAGATATINGVWNANNGVRLESNDIDITGTGGIQAGGVVTLVSTNGLQALIGDGFTGTGYALTNAEFGRVSGNQVQIVGRGDASAALDMLVGDLTVTGPQAGSNIEGVDGALVFAVGDVNTLAPSGVIRVVGDVNATGFGSGNAIEFYATSFELDAATGSVSILSSGSTLGGELGLYADRIHVASGTILDKLAANPVYTGYQNDLNKAAAVQRPEGVLRADTLWIESDSLQDILIQNTGSGGPSGSPAGFLVRQAFVNDAFDPAGPAGSINLIVNGQVVSEGATLTGVAARDALITPETDITPFTSNSTINGCPLTGVCVIRPPQPPPVSNVVDNQIDLITNNPLGDSDFGNEPDIDDNQEGDEGASNPISPPQPLFDTRPLIPSSDVNDPVSGTGNPPCWGDQCEEDNTVWRQEGRWPDPRNRRSLRFALLTSSLLAPPELRRAGNRPCRSPTGSVSAMPESCVRQVRPADRRDRVFDPPTSLCRDAASAVGADRHPPRRRHRRQARRHQVGPTPPRQPARRSACRTVTSLNCRDGESKRKLPPLSHLARQDQLSCRGPRRPTSAARAPHRWSMTKTNRVPSVRRPKSAMRQRSRTQAGARPVRGGDRGLPRNAAGASPIRRILRNLADREGNDAASRAEALANQGLQQSNMSNFGGADRLLAAADRASPKGNGIIQRLLRNYRAINQLNQHNPAAALEQLKTAVADVIDEQDQDSLRTGLITLPLADEINKDAARPGSRRPRQ
jgi:hypothetical protein